MVLWGVISTATAACNTVGGLYAARFFLGFVEATYFVSGLWPVCITPTDVSLSLAVCIISAAGTQDRSWEFARLTCTVAP